MNRGFGRDRPHLQLIVDGRHDLVTLVRAAARGGADSVQIRDKSASPGELLDRTLAAAKALDEEGRPVSLLVNGRLDIALLARADGLHLPEASFLATRVAECRRLAGDAPFIVGRSIHSVASLDGAQTEQLDYVLFGHVFPTSSKKGVPPRGLDALARVAARSPVPVLAVGGITPETAGRVLRAGAAGVAVISAIARSADPFEATVALRMALLEESA